MGWTPGNPGHSISLVRSVRRMNDPVEFVYSKQFLAGELEQFLKKDFIARKKNSLKLDRKFKKAGGLRGVVNHEAANWIDSHYNSLFYWGNKEGRKTPYC